MIAAGALHAHTSVWQTPFIAKMRHWRPGSNGRDDGIDTVSGCILAEPVRRQHPNPRHRRFWRDQRASIALGIDFIP